MEASALPPRPIRSYVRRSGRMTDGQRRAVDALWVRFGVSELPPRPERLFTAAGPCVLEIGFGNGEALVERARGDLVRNYLGLEVHEPGVGHILLELARAELTHVRVSRADASDALTIFEDASFAEICIWFPDPWPKKRHHKRRLVQGPTIAALARVLAPRGILHYATDDAEYAAQMALLTTAHGGFGLLDKDRCGRPVTRFERRARTVGREVHDLRYQRLERDERGSGAVNGFGGDR